MSATGRTLLIVAHAPSPNTRTLRDALIAGAEAHADGVVQIDCRSPFDTDGACVRAASGVILSTTENLAYMSGALKDFFDRTYYDVIDHTQGLPYALQVRAGNDGSGTCRAVERIVTGLAWRAVAEPLVCRGPYADEFATQCRELGGAMASGLAAGIL